MDATDDLYGLRGTNEQEKLKRHRSRRLITRRSEVQVLLPQPEIRWNHLIPADYFCFLRLFCELYFWLSNLT